MRRGSLPNSIDDHHPPVYHASLHCTATQQVYHFATLEALFAFLLIQLAADGDDATATGRG